MNNSRQKKPSSAQRQPESRLYVSRPLDFSEGSNEKVTTFSNKVGRAIKGTGKTKSLGSMGLTLMSAQDFSQVRNNLSVRDRNKLSGRIDDFIRGLNEVLAKRPDEAEFCIKGLSLFGRNARSLRPGAWTTFGFASDAPRNQDIKEDIEAIQGYFEDEGLPAPSLRPEKMHVSVGEAQLHRIATGKNHDPNLFIPAGLVVPTIVELVAPIAERIDG